MSSWISNLLKTKQGHEFYLFFVYIILYIFLFSVYPFFLLLCAVSSCTLGSDCGRNLMYMFFFFLLYRIYILFLSNIYNPASLFYLVHTFLFFHPFTYFFSLFPPMSGRTHDIMGSSGYGYLNGQTTAITSGQRT